jgi:NADH-quinone oxidoreductase subunit C
MSENHPTVERLQEHFGARAGRVEHFAGQTTVIVAKEDLLEIVRFLHDDPQCDYAQLTDVTGIDYLGYPNSVPRFALAYPLLSLRHNRRVTVKVQMNEDDLAVPSLTGIYRGADWPEREAAEMFGFVFTGHPDPRRLLLCELFAGEYPLRKDYPLQGKGERNSFKVVKHETA